MSILFEHVTVLTMDGSRTILKNAFVAVENEKISYVGTQRPEKKYDRNIDGRGKVLMPGFVNAHTHIPMQFLPFARRSKQWDQRP